MSALLPETCDHEGWEHCACYACRVACAGVPALSSEKEKP